MRTFCLILLAVCCWSPAILAQSDDGNNLTAQALEAANPRMVKIYGASAGQVEGYATGILISDDGQILTTQGVYLNGRRVRVVTADGKSHQASIIRRNRQHQLALLKIQALTPDHFELDGQEVGSQGDWVVAVANSFKVADKEEPLSATLGVISLRTSMEARLNDRDVAYKGDLILIDQITSNPGAAGGAVMTIEGKLVGLVGKIINSSETNTRLNYAIPNSVLKSFVDGKAKEETATVADRKAVDLGVKLFTHGGRSSPAYIDRVVRNGPAYKAKLKPDDLIVSIAGQTIGNVRQFQDALKTLSPTEEVIVVVKRGTELLRKPIMPREKK